MKITACTVIFNPRKKSHKTLCSFDQRPNATSAQSLANFATIFINSHSLQIGTESPSSGFLGPGSIATEGCFLSTMFTFSHFSQSSYYTIYPMITKRQFITSEQALNMPIQTSIKGLAEEYYHNSHPISSKIVKVYVSK